MMKMLLLFLFTAASVGAVAQPTVSGDPPNVIVILADDMGWGDMSYTGSEIDTPNLDRLAEEGMRLTSFYAAAPMCSPTRAALLTGRYPHSVGVPELASPASRGAVPVLALDHEAVTLPEVLGPHGYTSMLAGKWHLGFAPENWPRTHGFDVFWGSLLGTPGFYDVLETYHNETPIEVDGYFTDRITDEAVAYIRSSHDGPFFLYLAYNAPHYPLEAPAELVYEYRRRFPGAGLFAIYAAMVEQMDVGIGRVLEALETLGLEDNTLVVFTSDNGPSAEIKSYGLDGAMRSAGPLRGHKFSTHEGGIRVPFVARWPGRIPANTVREETATTMDLMPTILAAAGVPPPSQELHGISLLPLLEGGALTRQEPLHWENQHNMGVRQGHWKLVHQYWTEAPALYRIDRDLIEQHDLAGKHPEVVSRLQKAHHAWRAQYYPDPIPRRERKSGYHFPER